MRIVFSGASPLTIITAKHLIEEGHEVIIIEVEKEKIEEYSEELDCSFLQGDSARPSILSQVDPESCDILFCLTGSDQINIITALLGRSMGFKRVIPAIEDPNLEQLCREIGLESTIIPVWTVSRQLGDMVRGIDNINLSSLLKGDARFFLCPVGEQDAGDIDGLKLPKEARVIFFYRDGGFEFVGQDTKLRKGDQLVILTGSKTILELNDRWYPKAKPETGKGSKSTE